MMKNCSLGLIILLCISCSSESEYSPYSKVWNEDDRNFLVSRLESSFGEINNEAAMLTEASWRNKPDSASWSVALVVEHLITHDELFYRELQIFTGLPEMPPLPASNFSLDDLILGYREITEENTGKAPAHLSPLGRWCTKDDALAAYSRVRHAYIGLIKSTNKDLRKYYTRSGRGPTQYRDLHQLVLISIAHTERHLHQIQKIKTAL